MDSEVLDPGFVEMVAEVASVMRPLVHWYALDKKKFVSVALIISYSLNDMMTVVPEDDGSDDD